MFWRIFWRLLNASRGRLALALLAVASGAAVCAALVNLDLDARDRLTREFRTLGANVVVAPPVAEGSAATLDASALTTISDSRMPEIVGEAPYLYLAASVADNPAAGKASTEMPVIVAGTWFDQVAKMNSWWKVAGRWVAGDDRASCMVGEQAARSLGLAPGSGITLRYSGRDARLLVAGIVSAGGSEDGQIFVALPVAQDLAGLPSRVGLIQVSVRGSSQVIESVMTRLAASLPGLRVEPVRQLAAAEGRLLDRIHGLLFATVGVILLLTALSILAAMTGLALERRRDVGLMKAIGGSVRRVMRFFLAEAAAIGATGGVIGGIVGILLAAWIGRRVFAAPISPRLVVLPIVVALMIVVALAGALPLRLLGRVRPAEILRAE